VGAYCYLFLRKLVERVERGSGLRQPAGLVVVAHRDADDQAIESERLGSRELVVFQVDVVHDLGEVSQGGLREAEVASQDHNRTEVPAAGEHPPPPDRRGVAASPPGRGGGFGEKALGSPGSGGAR
jgi:hypothetical protein